MVRYLIWGQPSGILSTTLSRTVSLVSRSCRSRFPWSPKMKTGMETEMVWSLIWRGSSQKILSGRGRTWSSRRMWIGWRNDVILLHSLSYYWEGLSLPILERVSIQPNVSTTLSSLLSHKFQRPLWRKNWEWGLCHCEPHWRVCGLCSSRQPTLGKTCDRIGRMMRVLILSYIRF